MIDVDKIRTFLVNTYGLEFFFQYLGEKALDKVVDVKVKKELSYEEKWLLLFDRTLERLCKKRNWEYDSSAVNNVFSNSEIVINKLNDKQYTSECLCKLLGQDYGDDIIEDWRRCLDECIADKDFEDLFKIFSLSKLKEVEDFNKEILKLKDEVIKKIHVLYEEKPSWKERENYRISQEKEEEFKIALQQVENREYVDAIDNFIKINVWSNEKSLKYTCCYEIGYCYSQLARNIEDDKKAIKWFNKADGLSDPKRDDVVLLYRNIALVYISIGIKENKIENYNQSNLYFMKALQFLTRDDEYFLNDIVIHIGRNYMDMCDEIPVNQANEYLDIAMALMSSLYFSCNRLSGEQAFILLHNMARTYYHKAEKEGKDECLKMAQDLYLSVLNMDYTKRDILRLAMVNENIAMAYQYDRSNKEDNIRKAIQYYKVAKGLYQAEKKHDCKRKVDNINLDIASAYHGLFSIHNDVEDYSKAEKILKELINDADYMPNNSFTVRVYLLNLSLNVVGASNNMDHKEGYISKAIKSKDMLEVLFNQVDYEKYRYTFGALKCELKLLQTNENTTRSEVEEIRQELEEIKRNTVCGNRTISANVDELLQAVYRMLN